MKILLAALTSSFMLAACTPRIEVAAPMNRSLSI